MTIKTYPFDAADYMRSEKETSLFAEVVLEDAEDPRVIETAVRTIIRAHGLHVLAETTGLPRRTLVDALSGEDPDGARTLKEALVATSRLVRTEAAE